MDTKNAIVEVKGTPLVQIREERTSKAGRKLKAVMARWEGKALVIDSTGRLANRKELAKAMPENASQSDVLKAYGEAIESFNRYGEARIASQQSEIASGQRQLTRFHEHPVTGVVTIVTAKADKATKMIEKLVAKGHTKQEATDIVADLLG